MIGAGGEIFTESFGGYKGTQNEKQFQSGLNVAHSGKVIGWPHSGFNALHAVDRSFKGGELTPSDWAIHDQLGQRHDIRRDQRKRDGRNLSRRV